MEVSELCKSRAREELANKLVGAFDSAVKIYKRADSNVVAFATVEAASNLSFAGAKALFGILAAAIANTMLASIPSLNKQYYSGSTMPLK
ncbi:hypothetical protein ACJJI5_10070 [Microbulbifer sp. EKSA008]|uniref:hypothetical protein n=1 Tax=unclassified Microbulbifer TaxID=2619833 RepID=UPI00403A2DB6